MHLLAQSDPTSVASIGDFAGKFGFPALLVMVLLYGGYKIIERRDAAQEKRDAADTLARAAAQERDDLREKERREEREADRAAHVAALSQNTASVGNLGTIVSRVEQKVDTLVMRVEADLRLVKGG